MNRELIQQMQSQFDSLAQKLDDGTEFWFARDLQKPLGELPNTYPASY